MAEQGNGPGDSDFEDSFLRQVAQASSTPPRPSVGERLGGASGHRFRIISDLGRGGMGFVLRAWDEELQRPVALKFLQPVEGTFQTALLRQEARAIAQLDHENIVRLFDVSTWVLRHWGTVPFLVMECLEGESLAARLERPGMDVRQALELMAGVAAGLAHAHERHTVHRDLKPSNIFLTRSGTVKLLDFGLAQLAHLHSTSAPSLTWAGTPRYMAPEQWLGEPQDARTDIWAAGVLLFELLTGAPPYPDASTREALRARVTSPQPVPSVRERRPELPEPLERLVARTLAKPVSQRLGSAAELRDGLRAQAAAWGSPRHGRGASATPQHRHVTLVCCQLAGATPALDVEDVNELAAALQEEGARLLRAHDCATIVGMGDEVLGCYGHPVAHEDDLERAVRAGLALTSGLPPLLQARLPHLAAPALAVRVGLHTAWVVLNEAAPWPQGTGPTLSGEAPKLVTWLTAQAAPGTVVLSPATHARVRGAFETAPLGSRDFRGRTGDVPLELHQVLRERPAVSRFNRALAPEGLTPLVGRTHELQVLLEAWAQAREGHGRLVLLQGEAGIGKSRLAQELCERVSASPAFAWECQCWPQLHGSAYAPFIDLLRRHLELEAEDAPKRKVERLHARLGVLGLLPEHAGLLALLLSLPVAEDSPLLLLTPERRKEKTFEAVAALLLRLASERPLLLVVEDLHWADPTSLELLGFVLERIPAARLLLVASTRPGFEPSWPRRPHHHTLVLERLPATDTATLARGAAGGRDLSQALVEQLVEKSDGVPLFIEELTRMALERAPAASPDARGTPLPPTIPVTLQELLLARLDQLSPSQQALAQLCAVVGRDISPYLLSLLVEGDGGTWPEDLGALVDAGLLQPQDEGGETHYRFRHALLQEAAAQSLLRSTRRRYHQRIARVLAEHFPEVAEDRPELLAHHATQAGDSEQAIRYWTRAGERASRRSAHVEAIAHEEQALRLLQALPDPERHAPEELRLRIDLGMALVETRGYQNPEVERTYERAQVLLRQVGDTLPQLKLSYWGLFSYSFARAKYPEAGELGELLLDVGGRLGDRELRCLGHRFAAAVQFIQGWMASARAQVDDAIACSDFSLEQRRELAVKHWVDLTSSARAYAGSVYALLGRPDLALRYAEEALRLSEELAHPHTSAFIFTYCAQAYKLCRDARSTLACTQKAIALSREHRFQLWSGWSSLMQGWALSELGQPEEGLRLFLATFRQWRAAGIAAGLPHNSSMLAEIHLRLEQLPESLALVEEGLVHAEHADDRCYEPELHRLRGELLRRQGREPEATGCFLRSMDMARQRSMWLLELRTGASLARQREALGRSDEALRVLAPLLTRFGPELDSVDLREARELHSRLEGAGTAPPPG